MHKYESHKFIKRPVLVNLHKFVTRIFMVVCPNFLQARLNYECILDHHSLVSIMGSVAQTRLNNLVVLLSLHIDLMNVLRNSLLQLGYDCSQDLSPLHCEGKERNSPVCQRCSPRRTRPKVSKPILDFQQIV